MGKQQCRKKRNVDSLIFKILWIGREMKKNSMSSIFIVSVVILGFQVSFMTKRNFVGVFLQVHGRTDL